MKRVYETKLSEFSALNAMRAPRILGIVARITSIVLLLIIILLFIVPWVQTAYGTGKVITLNPNDRPQPINALVGGRIKQWFVEDGSAVKVGDPLLEIVDNDEDFFQRLTEQRDALQQTLQAERAARQTAELDLNRQRNLLREGLASRRNYELAKIKYNKKKAAEAKAELDLNKARVTLARQKTQLIRAPRDGRIVEIIAGDSATTIKAGDLVARFVPSNVTPAVELFVDGFNIPLIQPGRKVRLQFEGWPVIQFSGWPRQAIGTFGGVVHRIDPSVSTNGRFRVIIVADPDDEPWPQERFLRLGAYVKGWVLLETTNAGYELWRNLNNFPPNFPQGTFDVKDSEK